MSDHTILPNITCALGSIRFNTSIHQYLLGALVLVLLSEQLADESSPFLSPGSGTASESVTVDQTSSWQPTPPA